MIVYRYDGTFEGLLTVIFDSYAGGASVHIADEQSGTGLFGETISVAADPAKALRVWRGVQRIPGADAAKIYETFLSELPGREDRLRLYIHKLFGQAGSAADFGDATVLFVEQTVRKVRRERHRMEAFIRFEKSADGLFTAHIAPDFDVLPLLVAHFEERYADQRWFIYDEKRRYGIIYDLERVQFVTPGYAEQSDDAAFTIAPDEPGFADLWRTYFSAVNIGARKNTRLHLQHMPKRYWRYLTEKKKSY